MISETKESCGAMLQRLGADGAAWAVEFRKMALRLGYSDMDEGWLIGWFANAIECACEIRVEATQEAVATERKACAAICDEYRDMALTNAQEETIGSQLHRRWLARAHWARQCGHRIRARKHSSVSVAANASIYRP